ncbi:hypothetical protein CEQ21_07990 (plasmid) [Niallia circulans]|uniref:Uncharacterized protein n=1 Tax=Niallia circulans TaxID=1397 RepID=A0A553SQN4_NIACI|nr:hypothetical protein [Niallia circulans]TRZ39300.1 hypothetical protein CEQ21_07990 [Niallia circulans]
MKKMWLDADDILSKYTDGNFQAIEVGIQEIDPSKIIALSLDYETIKDDYKMEKLKEKVKGIEDWEDLDPRSLYLYKTPEGTYFVGSGGGNHRSVLTNELGISKIKANVTNLYPRSTFPKEITDITDKLYIKREQLRAELETSSFEDSFDKVDQLNDLDFKIDDIFYKFVQSNNLI